MDPTAEIILIAFVKGMRLMAGPSPLLPWPVDDWFGIEWNGQSYDINLWCDDEPQGVSYHAAIYRVVDGNTITSTALASLTHDQITSGNF